MLLTVHLSNNQLQVPTYCTIFYFSNYAPLHVLGNLAPIFRRTSVYLQHLVLCQSLLVTVQLEG